MKVSPNYTTKIMQCILYNFMHIIQAKLYNDTLKSWNTLPSPPSPVVTPYFIA